MMKSGFQRLEPRLQFSSMAADLSAPSHFSFVFSSELFCHSLTWETAFKTLLRGDFTVPHYSPDDGHSLFGHSS